MRGAVLLTFGEALCPSVPTSPRSGAVAKPSGEGGGPPSGPAASRAGAAVRRQLRLRRRTDFDAVFQRGKLLSNRMLVLRSLPNQLPHNRYGFITSKRLGNAVVRNRVRRRLREGIRSLPARPGWDVVVSARIAAAQADFHQLKTAGANPFPRAGILAKGPDASGGG